MSRLLSLVSVRIGLYIAAAAAVSYLNVPELAVAILVGIGLLLFALGLAGPLLPVVGQYAVTVLAVGAVTLGLGGLPGLWAVLADGAPGEVLGPVMRLVAALLGGLLLGITLYTLANRPQGA